MITKLRRNFILAAVIVVAVVIIAIVGGINVANYVNMVKNSDEIIDVLVLAKTEIQLPTIERPSRFPSTTGGVSSETPYSSRYFTVEVDSSGTIVTVDSSHVVALTNERALELAQEIIGEKTEGFLGTYRFRKIDNGGDSTIYYFLDVSIEQESFRSFAFYSVIFSFGGLVLITIFIIFVSRVIFKPVQESYEKQRRFITDAGHELNTPLSIISANAELLSMDVGESEWIDGIENQVAKLSRLTKNLVYVAKMEEGEGDFAFERINLSQITVEALNPFMAVSESAGKKVHLHVEQDVFIDGNEDMVCRMITLLMDNAFKHSFGEDIEFSLEKEGKKAVFTLKNGCDEIEQGDLSVLFERFYRPAKSRGKDAGGSGIGLSVVQSIAEIHKGKAYASSPDGKSIIFKIII